MEAKTMTHTQQLRTIRDAYSELPDMQDGFRDVREVIFYKALESERQHRKGRPEGLKDALGVKDAAKLFTVQYLIDGWKEPDKYTVDDIICIRSEVLYGQAYAKKFHKELADWAAKWAEPFSEVDYADLMQHGR